MEITDYLRTIGKRAWLLALIPALAGIVAAVVTISQPAAFRTSATLQLPRDDSASPQQVAQQFVDFRAAAESNETIQRVVEETGATTAAVRKVRIEQVGQSNFVTMSFASQSRDPEQARAVISSLAEQSLTTLAGAELERLATDVEARRQEVDGLRGEVDRLVGELNAVYARVGTTQLADEEQTVRGQQARFQEQAVAARAQGLSGQAATFESAAADLQPRIDDLRYALAEQAQLAPQLDDARAQLSAAQAALATTTAAQTSATPAVKINFNAEAAPVRRKARTARLAGAAVLAGIPVAVGLILFLDLLSRRRAARRAYDGEMVGTAATDGAADPARPAWTAAAPTGARAPNGSAAGYAGGVTLREERGGAGGPRRSG